MQVVTSYLRFYILHNAVTSECVLSCAKSWSHNYVPLCACGRHVGLHPQHVLRLSSASTQFEWFPTYSIFEVIEVTKDTSMSFEKALPQAYGKLLALEKLIQFEPDYHIGVFIVHIYLDIK